MSTVIDLASRRNAPRSLKPLSHPAGIALPFDLPSDPDLLIPEIRSAVCAGTYSADTIRSVCETVQPGDRVLVIGAGLGVVSSLAARDGASRVIAVEANADLIPYLSRTHALNGVPWVEVANGVLAGGKRGRVPFFVQHDIRASSLFPVDQSWEQAMIVPLMDLDLILEEEQINMIVCDIPATAGNLLAGADLSSVDRILVNNAVPAGQPENENDAWSPLASQGFIAERSGRTILFYRSGQGRKYFREAASRSA
jgi:FkbM family methyltransferase